MTIFYTVFTTELVLCWGKSTELSFNEYQDFTHVSAALDSTYYILQTMFAYQFKRKLYGTTYATLITRKPCISVTFD